MTLKARVVSGVACVLLLATACQRSPAPAAAAQQAVPLTTAPGAADAGKARPTASGSASAPASGLRRGPACDLISRAEMSELLDGPIGKPTGESTNEKTSCTYPPEDASSYAQAEITIEWNHGQAPSLQRQMTDAFSGSAPGRQAAHRIPLGDDASYTLDGVLSVRSGQTLVTIELPMRPGAEAKAIAVGTKLFERLGIPAAKTAASAPPRTPAKADEEPSILKSLTSLFSEADAPDEKAADADDPAGAPVFPDGLSFGGECPAETAAPVPATSALVPLTAGLTLTNIWKVRSNDGKKELEYECLTQVTAVTASYVDVTLACDGAKGTDQRRLCVADLRNSHFYLTQTLEGLPPVLSGTTMFSLSSQSFRELKATTITHHRFVGVDQAWRTLKQPLATDTDGTLHSGPSDRDTYQVIVNDSVIGLPVVTGTAFVGEPSQTEVKVLDDERFPLMLDYKAARDGFEIRYTKISYPSGGDIEKHLAVEKHVDVYGIYFDFASDRLRPESAPVLSEIAGVLARNPGWRLNINGHTDNVGGDGANLALSRRRSEAVRQALVKQYHVAQPRLATSGFGASQPKESNDTSEGRAKNRRVELIRQ